MLKSAYLQHKCGLGDSDTSSTVRMLCRQCWAILSNAEKCWEMLSSTEQCWLMLSNLVMEWHVLALCVAIFEPIWWPVTLIIWAAKLTTWAKLWNLTRLWEMTIFWFITRNKCRGNGACSKLGAQITNESLKSGCAKYAIYLIEAQKVDVQMRILAH